jgi:hypothetical protein
MPAALAAATTAAAAGQDSGPVLSSVSGGGGSGRGSNWADDACVDSDRLSAVMKGQTWLILEYADKGCLQVCSARCMWVAIPSETCAARKGIGAVNDCRHASSCCFWSSRLCA